MAFMDVGTDTQPLALTTAAPGALDTSRFLDAILAFGLLLFLLPLLVLIVVLVKAQDGGPAVYSQLRMGRGGRTFRCFKFRSMVTDADARLQALLARDPAARAEWENAHKLKRDPRITGIGRFLRESSLDELPQLFNVLRGEMSIVGPRPIVEAEIRRYGRYYADYCSVRPGITGLWQISGRSNVSYRRRVALDVAYARNRSAVGDLVIIARTVPAVLMRDGSC